MIVQDSVHFELTRGCEEVLPQAELEKKLQKNKSLK